MNNKRWTVFLKGMILGVLCSCMGLNAMNHSEEDVESGIAAKRARINEDEPTVGVAEQDKAEANRKREWPEEEVARVDNEGNHKKIREDEKERVARLFAAAKQGTLCVEDVRPSDLYIQDDAGLTLLHWASYNGHSGVVELLLQAGAQIGAVSQIGRTALHMAAMKGQRDVVALLLDRDATIDAVELDGTTALHYAAEYGHREVVEVLLDKGAQIDAVVLGMTALHLAAASGNKGLVELLLDRGAQIDVSTKHGVTSLYCAADEGYKDVVELLLDRGANKETAETRSGRNALHTAVMRVLEDGHGDRGIVELLLDKNAQIDATDRHDKTVLHRAVSAGHRDLIELLLHRGAQIGALTDGGWTALHHAVPCVRTDKPLRRDIVELLLDRRAEIGVFNHNGQTVLHQAASSGIRENVEFLVGRLMKRPSDEEVASACDQLRKIVLWEKIGRKLLHTRMPKDVLIYMVLLDESLWRNLAIILLRKIDHGLEIDTFFANEKVLSCAVQMILDAHGALLDHVYSSNLFYNADNRDLKPFFAPNERERNFSRLVVEALKRNIAKSRQNQNVVKSSQELVPREDVT